MNILEHYKLHTSKFDVIYGTNQLVLKQELGGVPTNMKHNLEHCNILSNPSLMGFC